MESPEVEYATLYGSDLSESAQREAFRNGKVPVAVYGLGKMGLPIATVYGAVTGNVIGVDRDDAVVDAINDGVCPIPEEPGLEDVMVSLVENGKFTATTDTDRAASMASVHVIIVPTVLNEDNTPDLSNLTALVRDVALQLDPGDLVVVESTLPPGTSEAKLWPLIVQSGRTDADDVGLAFCPERTMSGRALKDVRGAYPKVVGGIDAESTRVAKLIYEEVTTNDVYAVTDTTTAEAVKVFEGVYRDVNIALANELATLTDDLDINVNEAIRVANTQPYCDIHRPGIGVGGHCIPFYPHFLVQQVDAPVPLVRMARQTNENMPLFAVETLLAKLRTHGIEIADASVAVLGVTYRPGVNEIRKSPAFPITDELTQLGATVYVVDPIRDDLSAFEGTPATVEDLPEFDVDAFVLVTAHDEFETIDWETIPEAIVIDGRQALDIADTHHDVYTIGSG